MKEQAAARRRHGALILEDICCSEEIICRLATCQEIYTIGPRTDIDRTTQQKYVQRGGCQIQIFGVLCTEATPSL